MFNLIVRHKFVAIIGLLVITIGGYFGYRAVGDGKEATSYATAAVEKGTLIVSVSGSGQAAASEQVNIKPEVSGKIVSLNVANGEKVKAGSLLFAIDKTDYQKAVADAEIALETARLEWDDLLAPPDELTLLQSENALAKAKQSKEKAEEDIKAGHEDAFNAVTNVFFDLPAIVAQARDVLYGYDIAKSEGGINDSDWNKAVYQNSFSFTDRDSIAPFIRAAEQDYALAKENYDQNLSDYKNSNYNADNAAINNLLNETVATTKAVAQAVKSEINLLDFIADYFSGHNMRLYSAITSYRSSLKSYYSQTNSFIQNLSSVQRSLQSNSQALIDAEINLKEKELSSADLNAGADELAIRSKKNAVQQKEESLETAKQNLGNCSVFAPFSGLIAEINVKKGDTVSAASTAITLISYQNIIEITLNEIDAAKVKISQKANIVFDALPGVSISGKVIEVDTLGTASQGVVSYGVKIALDTNIEQVKPGMSATADIITEAKQDVLVLPNSAIKSQGNSYYVELMEANVAGIILSVLSKLQTVEIGLSNDLSTEIVSGLKEGDIVVISTIQARTTQTQGLQIPGINSGGNQVQMRNFNR